MTSDSLVTERLHRLFLESEAPCPRAGFIRKETLQLPNAKFRIPIGAHAVVKRVSCEFSVLGVRHGVVGQVAGAESEIDQLDGWMSAFI